MPRACPRLCTPEETVANPYDCPPTPLLPYGFTAACRKVLARGDAVRISGTGDAALDGQTGVLEAAHAALGWRVALDATGNRTHVAAASLESLWVHAFACRL